MTICGFNTQTPCSTFAIKFCLSWNLALCRFIKIDRSLFQEDFEFLCTFTKINEVIWKLHTVLKDWLNLIGHYNPSVRIIDIVSHTTYVVRVNSIHKWRNLQFLRNFSWQFYLFSEFLPEIAWEEIAKEMLFVFCFDVWPGARTLAFRLLLSQKDWLFCGILTGHERILEQNLWSQN